MDREHPLVIIPEKREVSKTCMEAFLLQSEGLLPKPEDRKPQKNPENLTPVGICEPFAERTGNTHPWINVNNAHVHTHDTWYLVRHDTINMSHGQWNVY